MDQTPRDPAGDDYTFPATPKIGPGGPPALQPPPDRWIAVPRALLAADISDFARTVYLWLLDHAGSRGTAWPGVNRLAEETRHSPRQVRRALAELRDAEMLSCHHRGLGQTDVYELRVLAPPPPRKSDDTAGEPRRLQRGQKWPHQRGQKGPHGEATDGRYVEVANGLQTTTIEQPPKNTHTAVAIDEAASPAAPGGVCVVARALEHDATPSPGLVAARLNDAGLSKAVTRRLVEKFGAVACQQQLDWLPLRKAREPAATLRRAIEESWLPPDGNPKIRLPGERPPQPLPPPPPLPAVDDPRYQGGEEKAAAVAHIQEVLGRIGKLENRRIM